MSNVMTSEFNDRIAAQRSILRAVNGERWESEPLLGLSKKAIDRWIVLNKIEAHSSLANLVADVSSKLFFLANKSQDQISEEYQLVRSEIIAARDAIVRAIEARQT
jgi:hypothetical protein